MRAMIAVLMASGMGLGGCASIVSGTNQPLTVETKFNDNALAGASCKLVNDKGEWFVTTPGSVTVHRAYGPLAVDCTKGASHGSASIKSGTKAMAYGNILFGGLIGAGVDVGTGAAYDYPNVITVDLGDMVKNEIKSEILSTADKATTAPVVAPVLVVAPAAASAPALAAAVAPGQAAALPKVLGPWSFEVEQMAKQRACVGEGAWITGKQGNDATYQVECKGGARFVTVCDVEACHPVS